MTTSERTWKIKDIDGSNERTVTLAQYLAEVKIAKVRALATYRANVKSWYDADETPY